MKILPKGADPIKVTEQALKNLEERYKKGIITKEQYEKYKAKFDKMLTELKENEELKWNGNLGKVIGATLGQTALDIALLPSKTFESIKTTTSSFFDYFKILIPLVIIVIIIYLVKK